MKNLNNLEVLAKEIDNRVIEDGTLFIDKKNKKKMLLVLIGIFVLLILLSQIGENKKVSLLFQKVENSLISLYKENNAFFWLAVICIHFGGSVTSIPTHIVTSIVTYQIVKSFWICYIILTTSSILGTTLCYVIYQRNIKLFSKMKKYPLVLIMK